jgi:hypothetical protein
MQNRPLPAWTSERNLLAFFTQQPAGRAIDEMQFGASLTDDGLMRSARWVIRRVWQPMLNVQSRLRTFEYDVMAAHAGQYEEARRLQT